MSMFRGLVFALAIASSSALTVSSVRTPGPAMKVPAVDDIAATPAQVRAEPPCAFFGGGGGVPEGAKCIFRPNALCTRKKCAVNKGPCTNNHKSMK